MRATLSKFGGSLGETGSVGFMFERVGEINLRDVADAGSMFEAALSGCGRCGIERGRPRDPHGSGDLHAVSAVLNKVRRSAKRWKWMGPQNTVPLDEDKAMSVLKLMDALDDNDDVQTVAANFDIPDA